MRGQAARRGGEAAGFAPDDDAAVSHHSSDAGASVHARHARRC